ncbi:MAG TPA: 2-oxoacid:acceptor oxidoreductase family protein [Solirubrobacterales bacterium]
MYQVRFHGRGGQGVVTSAELLSVAAFLDGRHAQAFPSFGSERTGAPVVAFCRIDDREIRAREPIARPDFVLVADPTLLHQVAVFDGLAGDGHVLINSGRDPAHLGLDELEQRLPRGHVATVPASELAREHLGRPLPNAAMLGGLAAISPFVSLESVCAAIRDRFPGEMGERNSAAARAAHERLERAAEPARA